MLERRMHAWLGVGPHTGGGVGGLRASELLVECADQPFNRSTTWAWANLMKRTWALFCALAFSPPFALLWVAG
jgi:hypothetical protein